MWPPSLLQGNSLAVGQMRQGCRGAQDSGAASVDRPHVSQRPTGTTAEELLHHKLPQWCTSKDFTVLAYMLVCGSFCFDQKLRKASQWTSLMQPRGGRRKEQERQTASQALLMVINNTISIYNLKKMTNNCIPCVSLTQYQPPVVQFNSHRLFWNIVTPLTLRH